MSITDTLIDFVQIAPPKSAQDIARLCALDWAACGIAGNTGEWHDFTTLQDGGPCAVIGGGAASVAGAALINGALSHALDYDDTHFAHVGHTTTVMMPAALAVGQMIGAALDDIIDASLIGAEAAVAVGLWLGAEHYAAGFHQTATAGTFGATLAACRLLHLNSDQTRHALGLATTMASGLKCQFGTMGKPLNAGLAARAGVEAALWAQAGVTSAREGLTDAQGFGPSHHGAGRAVPLPPAGQWRIETVSHKFHACCHGLHATLEALGEVPDLQSAPEVKIATNPRWLKVCNNAAPETGLTAKFSYSHVVAMAAHGVDTSDIAQFSDAVACRSDLAAWRKRVAVAGDANLSDMQVRVSANGAEVFHDLAATLPLPVRSDKVMQKARALVGARADDLQGAIKANDLSAFVAALR